MATIGEIKVNVVPVIDKELVERLTSQFRQIGDACRQLARTLDSFLAVVEANDLFALPLRD